jgi:hypothetical protein
MPKARLWATYFILAPLSSGLLGATIHLLWELQHVANRWVRPHYQRAWSSGVLGATICLLWELQHVANRWVRPHYQRAWRWLLVLADLS